MQATELRIGDLNSVPPVTHNLWTDLKESLTTDEESLVSKCCRSSSVVPQEEMAAAAANSDDERTGSAEDWSRRSRAAAGLLGGGVGRHMLEVPGVAAGLAASRRGSTTKADR